MDSIRNVDGIWVNTQAFREAALHFMKYGYYCSDPAGSPDWMYYWTEERRRCREGFSSGGARITGDHYYYLNYCPIQKVADTNKKTSRKIKNFPDFWDGDYNYFWSRNIARNGIMDCLEVPEEEQDIVLQMETKEQAEKLKTFLESLHLEVKIVPNHLLGGYDLIVGKSRRKGYSYKNSSIAANNYLHRPDSYTMLMAYEKKYLYPKGIFNMVLDHINFANTYTAWAMPSDVINRSDHIKASYIEYRDGLKLELGFMSEVQALTFKDNPDAGRGKDADDIIGEEVGAWGTPGGLKASYSAMQPSVKAGTVKTGMITLFGTSGDIEGGTADFADMHDRPLAYNFLPFYDVWGEFEEKVEGFFHPVQWNMEGHYDEQGNSNLKSARLAELQHRKMLIDNGATSGDIQARMQEMPVNSAEAFGLISTNNFPILELKTQLDKVKAFKWQHSKGTCVNLVYEGGGIVAKPILDGKANPIISYKSLPLSKEGCVVIYEQPVANIPKGLYKIGYDPVRQDTGTSLAGIIVYKGVHRGTTYHQIIVAEFIGRMGTPEDMDRILEKLCDYYGTVAMHENEVTAVKNFFRRIKRLDLLAHQPDRVISKNVKGSKVQRVYGCHMTIQLKDAGERYVKEWLLLVLDYDAEGNPIRVIDRIYSIRLLEELIAYNRKGNFDLVSALFMCMFQVQEEELGKEYGTGQENKKIKDLISMMNEMYPRSKEKINKVA
jgi:hypothetical protein